MMDAAHEAREAASRARSCAAALAAAENRPPLPLPTPALSCTAASEMLRRSPADQLRILQPSALMRPSQLPASSTGVPTATPLAPLVPLLSGAIASALVGRPPSAAMPHRAIMEPDNTDAARAALRRWRMWQAVNSRAQASDALAVRLAVSHSSWRLRSAAISRWYTRTALRALLLATADGESSRRRATEAVRLWARWAGEARRQRATMSRGRRRARANATGFELRYTLERWREGMRSARHRAWCAKLSYQQLAALVWQQLLHHAASSHMAAATRVLSSRQRYVRAARAAIEAWFLRAGEGRRRQALRNRAVTHWRRQRLWRGCAGIRATARRQHESRVS